MSRNPLHLKSLPRSYDRKTDRVHIDINAQKIRIHKKDIRHYHPETTRESYDQNFLQLSVIEPAEQNSNDLLDDSAIFEAYKILTPTTNKPNTENSVKTALSLKLGKCKMMPFLKPTWDKQDLKKLVKTLEKKETGRVLVSPLIFKQNCEQKSLWFHIQIKQRKVAQL
ncbi:unnamed protein product [Blepharisma stoltei]|uniref:Uncharacterized protein n=1 Tax=Blepharisma stoltei TaxID=1481888 RepID=A0AAU9IB27_9CILI|nr:unnamed protein product [Blepharisma stoltei]